MELELLFLMLGSLLVVLPIILWMIHRIERQEKIGVNAGATLSMGRKKIALLDRIYLFAREFPLTRGVIDNISRRYEIYYPSEPQLVARKTIWLALFSWTMNTLVIALVFLAKPNWHNAVMAIILVYVIHNEILFRMASNAEIQLLEQLIVFLSEVRHNYHINRMVDDAILDSLEDLGYEMKMHGEKLYEIITSNDIREEVIKYNATSHNKYLKMFLSLCTNLLEFTDKKINGQLLFTANLENLKREVHMELLKRKKLKFVFSGTVFVTIAVCIPIDAIQAFGKSIIPELEVFYTGRAGILSLGLIYLSAIIVYVRNHSLREIDPIPSRNLSYLSKIEEIPLIKKILDLYENQHYGKIMTLKDILKRIGKTISPRQLFLERSLLGILVLVISVGFVSLLHGNNRFKILNQVSFETIEGVNPVIQKERIEETILSYTRSLKETIVTEEEVFLQLSKEGVFSNSSINQRIAKEVYTRVNRYQKEVFYWYELLVCIGVSLLAFYLPYWMVLYKKKIVTLNMEDEVNQFNSIIYMLMYIDHMTGKDILEQLELFAVVFKSSLQECINEYNSGELEALEKLREKENFPPFRRMVDNFIRCDLIPMDKAFDEVASDRENYYERRKQENEITIQKRSDTIKTIAWIPTVLVLTYLLLPIFVASLRELEGFQESLSLLGY